MKKILFLIACLFTLPVMAKNTILVLGDSLSAAHGFAMDKGWVTLLQHQLTQKGYDYLVINQSVSGSTTSNGLARLPQALRDYKPQITIIELGANDGLRGLSILAIQMNLTKMIDMALAADSKVLVLGLRLPPNYGPEYTSQFSKLYTELESRGDITVLPQFLSNVDTEVSLMQADRLHPNEEAQPILLSNVWPVLEPLLK